MSIVTSNRLLPLLAGSVVLMAVLVAVKSCSPSDHQPQLLEAVPQAPKPDADTPADTIKTLTANVSAMTSELNALRRDNTALKQENRDLIEDRKQRSVESADSLGGKTYGRRAKRNHVGHRRVDGEGGFPGQPLWDIIDTVVFHGF